MLPGGGKSAGKGLGQQTGGNALSDAHEARQILRLIGDTDYANDLSKREAGFLDDMFDRALVNPEFRVTGKQLFWLRDIEDKLVERGPI
jgi:hypothetical protein